MFQKRHRPAESVQKQDPYSSLIGQSRICLKCRRPGCDSLGLVIPREDALEKEMATQSSILV